MIKHENGVSNVLDLVKARLRRIANSIGLDGLKESAKSLKEWSFMEKSETLSLKVPFYFSRLPN